jgi:hypothetical protein
MKSLAIRRNGWREPFAARGREGAAAFRRQWYWPVGGALLITLPCLLGLAIYSHELDEPWNLRMVAFSIVAGAVTFLLLTLDDFIPHVIRFRQDDVSLYQPDAVNRFLYANLRQCELTAGPSPLFRGLGESSQVWFEIYWHPALDPEAIRSLLGAHGVPFDFGPQPRTPTGH